MGKYVAADGSGSPFDLQNNFADVLIKLGLIKTYVPPAKPSHQLTWGLTTYTDGQPMIVCRCVDCGGTYKWTYEGAYPEQMVVPHARTESKPPANIIADYKDAVKSWKSISVKPTRQTPRVVHIPTY